MPASRYLIRFVLLTTAFTCGCSSSVQAEPRYVSEDPAAQDQFDVARELFEQGRLEEAEPLFEAFIIEHPEDPLRPAAELHLGRIAAATGEHDEASSWFEHAAASEDEALARSARRELGESLLAAGEAERALEVLEPQAGHLDGSAAAELYATLARAAAAVGDPVRQVRFLDAHCRYGGREACITVRSEIDEIVDGLEVEALAQLYDSLPRTGRGWERAATRLGTMAVGDGETQRAEELVEQLEQAGADDGLDRVRAALEQAQQVDWTAVGALLPLSGRARLVGEQMRAGLELAAADPDDPTRLVVRDAAVAPEELVTAIDDLIENEHVAAIIGPVDAASAEVAARRAEELGVPLLALSIRPDLPDQSPWVVRAFQSNEAEVRLLVDHARDHLGLRSFAILHPDSGYGRVLRELTQQQVESRGGVVEVVQSYEPSTTSFVEVCQQLAEHEFQALIIPDRSRTISLIAPALATAGLWSSLPGQDLPEDGRSIQLLLPSTAFDPRLIRQAGRYLQGAVFATVLWTESPNPDVVDFVEAYREAHGSEPSPYAAQAHDALQLIRTARAGAEGRLRSALHEALLGLRAAPTAGRFEGFDEQGEPLAPLRLLTLEGETFVE